MWAGQAESAEGKECAYPFGFVPESVLIFWKGRTQFADVSDTRQRIVSRPHKYFSGGVSRGANPGGGPTS